MTTEQKQLAAIIAAAIFLALLTCTWFWGYDRGRRSVKCPSVQTDTIVRIDTIVYDHPAPVAVKPAGMEMYPAGTLAQMQHLLDSLSAFKPDTTFVEIPVPIETKRYGGRPGDEYEAQVSGWHPSLDWIKVNQRTVTITNTIQDKRRWTFGVTAGPGVFYDFKKVKPGVGIVFGFGYNF